MTDELPRAVLVLPGRGAYTAASLGSLPAHAPLIQRAETLRAELGLDSLLALDAADEFEPSVHLRPANASPLNTETAIGVSWRLSSTRRAVTVISSSVRA